MWLLRAVLCGGAACRAHSRNSMVRHAAGLCPVALPGVENINLSGLIEGHTAYLERMDEVLVALNMDAE